MWTPRQHRAPSLTSEPLARQRRHTESSQHPRQDWGSAGSTPLTDRSSAACTTSGVGLFMKTLRDRPDSAQERSREGPLRHGPSMWHPAVSADLTPLGVLRFPCLHKHKGASTGRSSEGQRGGGRRVCRIGIVLFPGHTYAAGHVLQQGRPRSTQPHPHSWYRCCRANGHDWLAPTLEPPARQSTPSGDI